VIEGNVAGWHLRVSNGQKRQLKFLLTQSRRLEIDIQFLPQSLRPLV
jgi:hypothetical protein